MANNKSIGLPGGPNEYITDISEYLSVDGYKFNSPDVDNPFNIIKSGSITMEDVEFPVLGTDNFGNSQMMEPGMTYEFPGDMVFEMPMAQNGNAETRNNVATIARKNEESEMDFSRPPVTMGDYLRFWNHTGEGLCKDNTCVETVKQIYKEAGIDSIPENVYDNKTFLENHKDYGFTQITDEKDIQAGDVIQYYIEDNPYHMGINVYPGEYVSDGERNAPIQNKNMYVDQNGDKKDPFRIFRYNKKYGGDLPKAQYGDLPEHLDPVDLSNLNEQNKQKINSSAYRDRLKKEYLNAHDIELDNEQLDGMVSDLNNQLTLGANEGNTGFYTQNVPDPSAAGFMFSGAGQIDALGNQVSPRTDGYDYSNPTIGNIYIARNASQKEPFTTINNEDGTSMEESIKQHEINHRLNSLSGSPLSSSRQSSLYDESYDYHNSFFSNAPEDNPFNPNTKDKEFRDYATQPFEIKSQKAQLEQALLDAGIWDPSKGPFTQADVNKMVNSGISFNKGFDYLQAGLGINELVDGTIRNPGKLNNEMDYYSKYTNEKMNDFLGDKGYENFSIYSSDPEMRDMRRASQRPFERINKTLQNTDQGSKKWNEWSEKSKVASNNYYNANSDTRDLKEILDGEYDYPSKNIEALLLSKGIKVGDDGFYKDKDNAAIQNLYNQFKKTSDDYKLTYDEISDDRPKEEGLFGAFGPIKNLKGNKAKKQAVKEYNSVYGTNFKKWDDIRFDNSEVDVSEEDKNVLKNSQKYTGYGNIVESLDRETDELNTVLRGAGGYDTKKEYYNNEFKLKGDYRPSYKGGRNEFNIELANNYMNDLKNDPNYDPKKDVFNNNFVPNNNFDKRSAWAYDPNGQQMQEQNRKGFNTALKNNIWRDDLYTQAVLNLPAKARDSFIEYYNQDQDQKFGTKTDITNQRNLVRTLKESMPEIKNFIQNARNNNNKFIENSNRQYKIDQQQQFNNDELNNRKLNEKISPNLIKFMNEVAMEDESMPTNLAQYGNNESKGEFKQYDPPGFFETVGDVLANPVTAFGYSARGENIPDRLNVNNPTRNPYDMAADVLNPFAWYQYAENADQNFAEGEILDGSLNALGAIPFIPAWLSKAKNLTTPVQKTAQSLLAGGVKDVQKVKPFNFKTLPGVESKEFIRVIDGEFTAVDYKHLIPTKGEIADIAKKARERLLTDKFINNNIKATGRSRKEILGFIDGYIDEFQNSVIQFNKLSTGDRGLYTKGKITIDPLNKFLTKDNVLGTLQHEIEHMFSSASRQGADLYRHPTLKLIDTGVNEKNTKLIKNLGQPFEQQVRFRKALDWLQTNAGLKPGGNVTDLQVEKLTDAMINWSKGKDFIGKGAFADVGHLFSSLDRRQFLSKGEYLLPGAYPYANLKKPNVRSAIKDILNKTFSVAAPVAVGSQLIQEQDGNGEAVMNNLDKISAQRRNDLNKAIETVVSSQGGSNDLRSLLLMTAAMENSYGADSTAYINPETGKPRTYTRGMMSIDDIAYDDLYKPRGEKGKYSAKQLQNYKWLESLGLDYKNMDDTLRSGDPLAGVASARLQYSRVPDALPKSTDLNAMYNYYMKHYNKTDADHKDRFTKFYNEFIPKEKKGGELEMLDVYKDYVNGKTRSQEASNIYDKLNRIHLKDARGLGMTVPNYILTHL